MRALKIAGLAVVGFALVAYTVGLGIFAATSTAPAVDTQPATPAEADATLRALGLRDAYPFESRFAEVPHGRMHYLDEGAGSDTVLCVHGNPTWSFLYRNFAKGLSGDARVVAPDLIGFGLSQKLPRADLYSIEGHIDDLSSLVEQLDLRNITLVVQDWGGPIGIGMAMRHPERIRAIVAMNTIAFPLGDAGPPLALRVLRIPLVGELLVQGLGLFNRVFVPAAIAREDRRTPTVRAAYDRVQGSWQERAGTLAFPRLIPRSPDDPVVPLLEKADAYLRAFTGSALIIWGTRDPVFGPALIGEWRERLPHAAVVELDVAGHYLQEDAAERIVSEIAALLRGATR